GYIAYDFRNTGRSSFNQIGVGLEFLSPTFDARINGYFPVGATRNQVATSTAGGFAFVGNSLVLSGLRQFETAATVVDAEVGREIVPIGSNGSLRAYAGTYLISAQGSPTVVGVKGRVEALPSDFFNVGVSVQNDGLFDTRVVFTVGASFPGTSPQGGNVPPSSALNRIAENVGRQSAIIVADPTVSGQTEVTTELARNPNGVPYRFLHVRQGAGGNGTNENPFTSVQAALANDASGDIIYVRGSGTESFDPSLDAGVSLLFSRVEQRLPLFGGGTVVLPGSNNAADVYTINATGSLDVGSNSVVSGLILTPGANIPGITATGASNVDLNRNTITTTGARGINLQNATGTVTIANNTVNSTGVGVDAISVSNNSGNVNLNVTSNTATAGNNGINVVLSGTATGGGTISNNTANNSVSAGIFLQVDTPDASAERVFTIANNTVTNNGTGPSFAPGIQVEALNNARLRVTIDSNVVTGNADGGVGLFTSGAGTATLFSRVRLNTITGNGGLIGDLNTNIVVGGNNTRLCIQPNNNTIGTFNRQNNAGGAAVIQVEGPLPGTNTITSLPAPIGTVNTVAAGTCGF
ncbi:MAG: right-handed parallel beta-helix repeat-containing protein, partial [Cyanobacteria bacterium]|nr:right-handed parallel beta-helix repeat-containing protein [Cyanobacteriota bacterium]MDW8201122.1 right-handed parallel beta-helix repeat-containing protein [Cyanobacteriota bacterium SKYGB_h_bin112]